MIVTFFTGTVRTHQGEARAASWANTPFGAMLLVSGEEHAQGKEAVDVVTEDLVTTCELPGIDRPGMETIVSNILEGRFLERSGVQGKGDAVLFLLVNEAIHALEEIARKEKL